MASSSTDPVIQGYRERITEIDGAIVAALNTRIELVKGLKAYKDAQGLDFVDAAREERVLAHWCQGRGGPASSEGLREICETILEWTKREVARRGKSEGE